MPTEPDFLLGPGALCPGSWLGVLSPGPEQPLPPSGPRPGFTPDTGTGTPSAAGGPTAVWVGAGAQETGTPSGKGSWAGPLAAPALTETANPALCLQEVTARILVFNVREST